MSQNQADEPQENNSSSRSIRTDSPPLCVDLDGTLIRTDLLFETLLGAIKISPWVLLLLPIWILRGRGYLKTQLASRYQPRVELLPYRVELLALLRQERAKQRQLVLASASQEELLNQVNEHLQLFDRVIGSNQAINLKGGKKAERLVAEFGNKGFDYVGDSGADIAVWRYSRRAIVVGEAQTRLLRRIKSEEIAVLDTATATRSIWSKGRSLIKALRIYQWAKNLLLFVPLVMAHKFLEPQAVAATVQGFISFSLLASSVYLLNDLFDLDSDRAHPRKRLRPFAAGDLPIPLGLALIPLLVISAFTLAYPLPSGFIITLSLYLIITLLYTFRLKRLVLIDVFTLAALYTLRIFAGGEASDTPVTNWAMVFSMFMFLSLGAVKRFAEILATQRRGDGAIEGRGYRQSDLEIVGVLGAGGGLLSALVSAMYVTSEDVTKLYSQPELLLLICPLVLYWISRVWLLAYRGELLEDPILFAITDRASYWVGAACLLIILVAI